jgi:hypothetical protein
VVQNVASLRVGLFHLIIFFRATYLASSLHTVILFFSVGVNFSCCPMSKPVAANQMGDLKGVWKYSMYFDYSLAFPYPYNICCTHASSQKYLYDTDSKFFCSVFLLFSALFPSACGHWQMSLFVFHELMKHKYLWALLQKLWHMSVRTDNIL